MRDAFAAETDDDFDLPSVVRRKASPRPQPRRAARQAPRKTGLAARVIAQVLSHPGRGLAAMALTGVAGAIAWNALVLQSTRHPAPLFAHRDPAVAAAPAPAASGPVQLLPPARPGGDPDAQAMAQQEQPLSLAPASIEAAPAPAPRASSRSAISDLIRNNGVAAPQPQRTQQAAVPAAPPVPVQAPAGRMQTVRDPIAEMIRLGGPVPTPPANVGRPDGGDIVLTGQRALARLGYGVTVDGEMGPETRQAIQRFEQDRHLPVTGMFGSRTARELSSASGIAVQ